MPQGHSYTSPQYNQHFSRLRYILNLLLFDLVLNFVRTMAPALDYFSKAADRHISEASPALTEMPRPDIQTPDDDVYYNPRLDPKNFLEGPLSDQPATRLRQMLARPGIVVAPGICDGISARCALEAGFSCLYQRFDASYCFEATWLTKNTFSGAATTASRLGQPDLAIATMNDFVDAAEMVCSLDPKTPVIADADTGFGGPAMVARTVKHYARAGVAALHIEDQVQTKRCGHLLGKQVVSREEFLTRIRAAVLARDSMPGNSDFVIIARTDSAQVLGMEEAVLRLKLAANAGADVCFIEGVRTKDLLESTVKALAPKPVLVNVISGGLTPSFTYKEAEQMGAKIIIFSLVSSVAMLHACRAAMYALKKTGTDFSTSHGMDPKQFFEVMAMGLWFIFRIFPFIFRQLFTTLRWFASPILGWPKKSDSVMDIESTPSSHTPSASPKEGLAYLEGLDANLLGGRTPYYNPRLDPKNYLEGPLSSNSATRLRQLLARPGIVVAPGICDGISARCAIEAGFECLYQSGAATTASRLGQPDLAIATLNDFAEAGEMVSSISPSTPVIADADTGFGGPANIARTIHAYVKAGIAGLHIEDQVQTKRCGHLMGKQVVSREEFITRIRAAVIARDQIPNCDFVIIGRTDSAQVLGMEEAITRLKLAAAAGADVCFIEGVKTETLLRQTVAALSPKPVLVNVISGGLTPSFTTAEAERMGAKIIIFSLVSCVAMVHGMRAAMKSLKSTGTDFATAQSMDPKKFFELMGLNDAVELDSKSGGSAFHVV
ncbi:hypothetical protein CVT24_005973 [Panaeolus cyanescens]|uniref:Oxaloacetate acetylhydrolase n=1 Tax=Panaeolus cyanescens TaxID=181874 RepID=A0A409VE75_9AGAR|nr:hypothetical protein CVT24_005973 [Panaeolus cyanescens]